MNRCSLAIIAAVAAIALSMFAATTDLLQANSPESALIQLTTDKAVNVRPAWSPDNQRIAYQSNRGSETFHIFVMNADGKNNRALTQGNTDNRHPVWTRDGKAVLFDSFDGKSREIWQVNLSDGRLTQLTRLGGLANFPAPSPDDTRFMFYYYKDDQLNLWSARMDGSDAKPLTQGLASGRNNQCTFACHRAAWSPDGQAIALSNGDHRGILIMRSDGSNLQSLVATEEHNHFPWFLADGRLGFISEHISSADAWTEAWAYDFKTGEVRLLHERISIQGPLEWSNDVKRVLFHSPRSGNFQIYMINLGEPGGESALRGSHTHTPSVTVQPSEAASDTSPNPTLVAGIGAIIIAALAMIIGFIIMRRARPGSW